ncbi:MAG: type I 3-dehydroquinate dehydratase [Candidatus Moranbacteria bacterium]|nr:type I 3-dehydroquinate dehydratase [Candidatus Moranbacteria bacterium]
MREKICVPITDKNLQTFLKNAKKAARQVKWLEFRIDYLKQAPSDYEEILQNLAQFSQSNKTILTCRKKEEGGVFSGSEEQRIRVLNQALKYNFTYVDIELSTIEQFDLNKNKSKTKIICSFHDFKQTPKLQELKKIRNKIKKQQTDVAKITTMVNSTHDIKNLSRLLLDQEKNLEQIVIGMGNLGKITRVFFPKIGSLLTYARLNNSGSAPGQLTVEQVLKVNKLINADREIKN